MHQLDQYIDGAFVPAAGGARFASESPLTREPWAEVPDSDDRDVELAVAAARRAFDDGPWATMLPQQRARLLRRLAELCETNADRIAPLEVHDNGKLLAEHRLLWVLIALIAAGGGEQARIGSLHAGTIPTGAAKPAVGSEFQAQRPRTTPAGANSAPTMRR